MPDLPPKEPYTAAENDEIKPPSHFRAGTRENLDKKVNEIEYEPTHLRKVAENGIYALERADNLMRQVEQVRKKNLNRQDITKLGAKATNFEYGQKKRKELGNMLEKEEQKLRNIISGIDDSMERSMGDLAENSKFGKETRDIVRNMEDQSERVSFVRSRILEEDWETVEEVLGAPRPHLIGIDKDAHESLKNMYKKRRFSDRLKTQEVLREVANKMGDGYAAALDKFDKLHSEDVEKAIELREDAQQSMSE